ncbi:MAG: hypothetical protein FJ207_10730 [Gemmatimonadetes bacterium]|nr:hypothetical protein [Gemmatimonadota bacterium]
MQKHRTSAGVCPAVVALVATVLLVPSPSSAQDFRFPGSDIPARVVGREGTGLIIEAEGPPLAAPREFFYRPSPPFDVRNRWILVQDSTFGVVFSQGSGVKADISGFAGDLYLRSLAGVRAVEVRALVFNLWGDFIDQLSATVLVDRGPGETWEFHPVWSSESSPRDHRTSIVWVNRVMFDDQSILDRGCRHRQHDDHGFQARRAGRGEH